jgi:hypothetical protein
MDDNSQPSVQYQSVYDEKNGGSTTITSDAQAQSMIAGYQNAIASDQGNATQDESIIKSSTDKSAVTKAQKDLAGTNTQITDAQTDISLVQAAQSKLDTEISNQQAAQEAAAQSAAVEASYAAAPPPASPAATTASAPATNQNPNAPTSGTTSTGTTDVGGSSTEATVAAAAPATVPAPVSFTSEAGKTWEISSDTQADNMAQNYKDAESTDQAAIDSDKKIINSSVSSKAQVKTAKSDLAGSEAGLSAAKQDYAGVEAAKSQLDSEASGGAVASAPSSSSPVSNTNSEGGAYADQPGRQPMPSSTLHAASGSTPSTDTHETQVNNSFNLDKTTDDKTTASTPSNKTDGGGTIVVSHVPETAGANSSKKTPTETKAQTPVPFAPTTKGYDAMLGEEGINVGTSTKKTTDDNKDKSGSSSTTVKIGSDPFNTFASADKDLKTSSSSSSSSGGETVTQQWEQLGKETGGSSTASTKAYADAMNGTDGTKAKTDDSKTSSSSSTSSTVAYGGPHDTPYTTSTTKAATDTDKKSGSTDTVSQQWQQAGKETGGSSTASTKAYEDAMNGTDGTKAKTDTDDTKKSTSGSTSSSSDGVTQQWEQLGKESQKTSSADSVKANASYSESLNKPSSDAKSSGSTDTVSQQWQQAGKETGGSSTTSTKAYTDAMNSSDKSGSSSSQKSSSSSSQTEVAYGGPHGTPYTTDQPTTDTAKSGIKSKISNFLKGNKSGGNTAAVQPPSDPSAMVLAPAKSATPHNGLNIKL